MIVKITNGIVADAQGRALCPACLTVDPCRCGASMLQRGVAVQLLELLQESLARLPAIPPVPPVAPSVSTSRWGDRLGKVVGGLGVLTIAVLLLLGFAVALAGGVRLLYDGLRWIVR